MCGKLSSEPQNCFLLSHRLGQEKHNKIYTFDISPGKNISGRDATITSWFFLNVLYLMNIALFALDVQIPCADRCLNPQTSPEKAFRGSNYLLTRYLEDFG